MAVTPLPAGTDPAQIRRAVLDATAAVAKRVVENPDDTVWLGKWRPSPLTENTRFLPALFVAAFPEDGGEPDLSEPIELLRSLAANRARRHLAREHAMQLAVNSSRESLRLVDEELANHLPTDVCAVARRRLGEVQDLYTTEYLIAFFDEAATLAAEQEELSTLLLDTTKAGFALGNPEGTISVANDAFVKFFGAIDDPVGRTWADVLGMDDVDDLLRQAEGGEAWRELTVRDRMGEERTVRVSLHSRRDRVQAVVVDVSMEAELGRRHRDFVRGLIHDLRSPLAVISGWSHTLVDDADRIGADLRAEALGTINRAAQQLTRMSDNLLELTLLEGGTHRLDVELIDAGARLRHIVRDGYSATVEGPDEIGVLADAGAFERMFTNLLDNAVAHGRPPVTVRLAPEEDCVRIDVVDQGEVDPAVLATAEQGRVSSASGFGLGLRTALLLARAHGGDVKLVSAAPTTFSLELPAAAAGS
ncbi:MAG: PAS domain-containing sensor histidine kinase [Acidimicrobiia bacterium]|nr:PAS domain-containing sensor histidine kinase [Acidimicrobiia bacterium]